MLKCVINQKDEDKRNIQKFREIQWEMTGTTI